MATRVRVGSSPRSMSSSSSKRASPRTPPGLGIMSRMRTFSKQAKTKVKRRRASQTRRLSYDTHYKVYRKQIESHTFDERTKMSFRDLGMLAVLYDKRWIYEDSISAIVCFQLLLVLASKSIFSLSLSFTSEMTKSPLAVSDRFDV